MIKYTLRRWLSINGDLIDDSLTASSPEEAVKAAEKLSGIFKSLISEDKRKEIMDMAPGDKLSIKRPAIKFTLNVKRAR